MSGKGGFWSSLCPCFGHHQVEEKIEPPRANNSQKLNISSQSDVSHLVTQVAQRDKQAPAPVPMRTQPAQREIGCVKSVPILLPPWDESKERKKCLVLDLDETLVHSSFVPIPNADFVMTLDMPSQTCRVYVRKRPGVDQFLKYCGHMRLQDFFSNLL